MRKSRATKGNSVRRVADMAVSALEEMKGQSITCINVSKLTPITDYMVIATGTSNTHIKSMADEVIRWAKEADIAITGVEGRPQAEWILVDLGSVVVHVMLAPVRALYNLEDLWNFDSGSDS